MIGFIKGILIEKDPSMLLIDVNGIGYEVSVPMTTFYNLPSQGKEITLHTHFTVREDAQLLYGFKSKIDKKIFQELIKVSGIGAKIAIAILSGMEIKTLFSCIENKNYSLLSTIPGIGKKTAERLVIETSDKILKLSSEIFSQDSLKNNENLILEESNQNQTLVFDEAVNALIALGYKQALAEKMIRKVIQTSPTVEDAIKQALQNSLV